MSTTHPAQITETTGGVTVSLANKLDTLDSSIAANVAGIAANSTSIAANSTNIASLQSQFAVVAASAGIYANTAAGIAATTNGQYFNVPSAVPGEALILYKNVSGVATEQSRTPTAGSVTQPIWTGKLGGWFDPFFRRFDLTTRTYFSRDRWWWNGVGTTFGQWSLVPSTLFDGFALRGFQGSTGLSGPAIWVDELGATTGDTITVYLLVIGSGAVVNAPGGFYTLASNGTGTLIGSQFNAASASGGTTITTSATPQWLRHVVTVPAGATRFVFYPGTSTAGQTFDIQAVWAFKGDATKGPAWPSQNDELFSRLSAAPPVIVVPSLVYFTAGREGNIYFDNLSPSVDNLLWDVSGPAFGHQQNERFTWIPAGVQASTPLTLAIRGKNDDSQLAVATTNIQSAALSANSGLTPKCIFIGDSLLTPGTITGELLNIAAGDVMGIALYGTIGSGANKYEGRGGWNIQNYTTAGPTNYQFTVSGVVIQPLLTATRFTHNGSTYLVQSISLSGGAGTFTCTRIGGSNNPLASGTLTKVAGDVGDATDAFSASAILGGNPFFISGALNFPQYLTNNSIPIPDWVFIELGINDCVNSASDTSLIVNAATGFTSLDTLITTIKAAGAGVKVGLMIPTPPSSDQDSFGVLYFNGLTRARAKRNIVLWAQQLIARYDGQTASRIYLVPSNVNLDTTNNMLRDAATPVNSRNSSITVTRQLSGVHPDTPGYNQIADAVWAFLKNN